MSRSAALALAAACDQADLVSCGMGVRRTVDGMQYCVYEAGEPACPAAAATRVELSDGRVVCGEPDADRMSVPDALCAPPCAAIQPFVPTRVGTAVAMDEGRATFVLGDDGDVLWVLDTDSGAVTAYGGADPASAQRTPFATRASESRWVWCSVWCRRRGRR